MNRSPLVSVVTPIHNDADVLEQCIDSVLAQTFRDWDYTIIDNASTDRTPEIAHRYVRADSRIHYLRYDELVDVNANYNRAFDEIHPASTYCKVLAADDWLYPECLERMVEVAERSDAIGIVGAYRLAGEHVDLTGLPYSESIFDGRSILRRSLLGGFGVIGGPSSMLLRSNLVRESAPFLDPRFVHADTEAAYRILNHHAFGYVHQVLTYARRQPGRQLASALKLNIRAAEKLRFLLTYGPTALSPQEYRRTLRRELWLYAKWHTAQVRHVSWLRNPEFFAAHRSGLNAMLEESGDRIEVRAVVMLVRLMLARGRWAGADRGHPASEAKTVAAAVRRA